MNQLTSSMRMCYCVLYLTDIYIYISYTCFEDTIFEFPLVAGLISTCGKMTSLGKMKTKMAASINQYSGMLYSHGWLTDLKFNPVYRNINEINE
jgi:hypothetical protein